ncbi:MAG TPA: tRNA (adenosine(37)-N6)-threonylcarbamoyltransferase complex transferase subunit TsaD [Nitrospiria bacterium]|nr:tRNA (adenosine(37)-N6)-threonylcarbamoyltransferase complex transferase subunit TsaD [Nitrospiria bacterium]
MLIFGIETSCDETAAALVSDGNDVLSDILFSQSEIHGRYGGVVPELACRRHIEIIDKVATSAIETAGIKAGEIDAVAVTHGPGLIGALLVGVSFAKSFAYSLGIPLIGVNHLEGHLLSVFLEKEDIIMPFVALIVSGGHTNLYYVKGAGRYTLLGRSVDDAAGEAFDKASKMLGLEYPGGPVIDRLAKSGDPEYIRFPRAYLSRESLDFSFSGLKTALLNHINNDTLYGSEKNRLSVRTPDIAASFQQAVVDVLVEKTILAAYKNKVKDVVVAGGVAVNSMLRDKMEKRGKSEGIKIHIPRPRYCTDNGAMIALAGYHHFRSRCFSSLDLAPVANLTLGE